MEFIFTADQDNWLNDLEKTRAKQGTSALHGPTGWCCLGRACRLAGIIPTKHRISDEFLFDGHSADLPISVVDKLYLRSNMGWIACAKNYPELRGSRSLVNLNDDLGWTFKQIARWIRKNPSAVFTSGYEEG
jgi:hypothetical protein